MFESHITVSELSKQEFIEACRYLKVKPVIIDMDTGSFQPYQMMTATFHKTDSEKIALLEMNKLAENFNHVVRKKLEFIVPKNNVLPPYLYLEFHGKYDIELSQLDNFVKTVESHGGHTSRNTLKQFVNGDRCYHFATAINQEVWDDLNNVLVSFKRVSFIRECVVYDDNPRFDSNWNSCFSCFLKQVK